MHRRRAGDDGKTLERRQFGSGGVSDADNCRRPELNAERATIHSELRAVGQFLRRGDASLRGNKRRDQNAGEQGEEKTFVHAYRYFHCEDVHFCGSNLATHPPLGRNDSLNWSLRMTTFSSRCQASPRSGASPSWVIWNLPRPRKFSGMSSVVASPPLITPMNHCFPLRRAKATHFPISLPGRTIVSSHTAGIAFNMSSAGLLR